MLPCSGPSNHIWQRLLVRIFRSFQPGLLQHVQVVAQRVALDQLTYAPVNNTLMITYVALVADRLGWAAARAKVRAELPAVQLRGWRFWPCIQAVNQFLVPLRVSAAGAVGAAKEAGRHAAVAHAPFWRLSCFSLATRHAVLLLSPLQFRVLCNSAAAVCWTAFVITRARSLRSKSRKLPVFDLTTGHIADKMV